MKTEKYVPLNLLIKIWRKISGVHSNQSIQIRETWLRGFAIILSDEKCKKKLYTKRILKFVNAIRLISFIKIQAFGNFNAIWSSQVIYLQS